MEIKEQMTLEQRITQLERQIAVLKEIAERVASLETKVAKLSAENEQLKQNNQQETIQIGDITIPIDYYDFLLTINSISYDDLKKCIGTEETIKVKYYTEVALARKINDKTEEEKAQRVMTIIFCKCMPEGFEMAKKIASQTDNKDWINIAKMIRQIIIASKQNEQLKQNAQQGSNTLSTAEKALIISLAGIYNDPNPLTPDYLKLKVANDWSENIIIQYLARVALAKHINDKEKEDNAHFWGDYRLKCDIYKQWHDKIKNASAPEIVQMIKQLMNSAVVQKQEEHGQLTK